MMLIPLENKIFYAQHLLDSQTNPAEIMTFEVGQQAGKGLELYLKNMAIHEEKTSFARTYLVKSKKSHEIAAYFTLVLSDFVLPLSDYIRSFSGVKALYIYALPEQRLIEHYQKLGFRRLAPEKEQFVHRHVKPKYDDGCIFMYQLLA